MTKWCPKVTVKCVILVSVKVQLGITLLTDITTLRAQRRQSVGCLFCLLKINKNLRNIFIKPLTYGTPYSII